MQVQAPAVRSNCRVQSEILIGLTVLSVVFIGIAYATPVLVAIQSPISGLIFGFALWEAWKLNRKVQLAFNGPFRLAPGSTEAVPPLGVRGGRR